MRRRARAQILQGHLRVTEPGLLHVPLGEEHGQHRDEHAHHGEDHEDLDEGEGTPAPDHVLASVPSVRGLREETGELHGTLDAPLRPRFVPEDADDDPGHVPWRGGPSPSGSMISPSGL